MTTPAGLPRTLAEVRAEYVRQAQTRTTILQHGTSKQAPPYHEGVVQGWKTALHILDGLPPELCGKHALETLAEALNENRRRLLALTRATVQPLERNGRVDALGDATDLAGEAASRAEADQEQRVMPLMPAGKPPGEDLSDWSAYPRLPMDDVVMKELGDLALFLGGDHDSFTGDLLRLIQKADPANLNRIAAGFPRHVRAWLMFNVCSPVEARTLVVLLEATTMLDGRKQ